MVVGMVLDGDGHPLLCEFWPGNTTDVKSLIPIVARLQARFGVGQVCIVADRGMISQDTLAELERRNWLYILGARLRSCAEVRKAVLSRPGRYHVVHPKGAHRQDPSPLAVKEVLVEGRRYVVCFNEDQARKDAADREAILSGLTAQLTKGPRSLVGNKGYRKYLTSQGRRLHHRCGQGQARTALRWQMGVTHQYHAGNCGRSSQVQGPVACRGDLPDDEITPGDTTHLSPPGPDDSWPCLLFVPRLGAPQGARGPTPGP